MLWFTLRNGQWLRGGEHFPRFITNGGTVVTDQRYVQGVEKKLGPNDNTQLEGTWCDAQHRGWSESTIHAQLLSSFTVGGRTFNDVLRLSVVAGGGEGDGWWFAKGFGLIQFQKGSKREEYRSVDQFPLTVRIPCHPNAPCM